MLSAHTSNLTILAISRGALVLAALFSERRRAILERETRLQEALRAGRVIAFDWDVYPKRPFARHSEDC